VLFLKTQFKQNRLLIFSNIFISWPAIYDFCHIFAQIISGMETTRRSTGLYWILFVVSVAAFIGVYAVAGGYCSLVLPFNVTLLALALDIL